MNNFEQKAHDVRIKKLASWEHNIETYTTGKTDWIMIVGSLFIVGFGVAMLLTLLLKV